MASGVGDRRRRDEVGGSGSSAKRPHMDGAADAGAAGGAGAVTAEAEQVITYLLDIDGCLFKECVSIVSDLGGCDVSNLSSLAYSKIKLERDKVVAAIIAKNRQLFNAILADVAAGHTVRIACGSARIDVDRDFRSLILKSSDGRLHCGGSAFDIILEIVKFLNGEIAATSKAGVVEHDKASLTDVTHRKEEGFHDCKLGSAYAYGQSIANPDQPTVGEDAFCPKVRGFLDGSKILLVLAHIYANFNGDVSKPYVCKFYDNDETVLNKLLICFSLFPQLLPVGVRLRICQHVNGATHGESEVVGAGDPSQALTYKTFIRELALKAHQLAVDHGLVVSDDFAGDVTHLFHADGKIKADIGLDADGVIKGDLDFEFFKSALARWVASAKLAADEKRGSPFYTVARAPELGGSVGAAL